MKNTLLCLAALAVAAAPAIGQEQEKAKTDRTGLEQRVAPAATLLAASDLVGANVTNPREQDLGEIEDLVVYPNGDVAYAVVSYGGFLGMGDKLFAIPLDALDLRVTRDGGHRIVLHVPEERLKTAPGFDKDQWPDMASAEWMRSTDEYYAEDVRERRQGARGRPAEASARMRGSKMTLKASNIDDRKVKNAEGDTLGDIEEVIIDTKSGRVAYVVLGVGGFLGMGEHEVAVPWDAIKIVNRDGDEVFTLATTKEKLEKAPQFHGGRERWIEMSSPAYVVSVYRYYEVQPYWSGEAHFESAEGKETKESKPEKKREGGGY